MSRVNESSSLRCTYDLKMKIKVNRLAMVIQLDRPLVGLSAQKHLMGVAEIVSESEIIKHSYLHD